MRNAPWSLVLAALEIAFSGWGLLAAPAPPPDSPREYYNQGTRQFQEGKLREAESALQTAVAANDERVQAQALYNLGHVRFRQGVEALKECMSGSAAKARGDAANQA